MSDLGLIASDIRECVSMPEVCRKYGIDVNRGGFAKCIFHADGRPSMKIYPGKRGYYCFSCGAGGDVISFVQQLFSEDFKSSMQTLINDFSLNISLEGEAKSNAVSEAKRRLEEEQKRKNKLQEDYDKKLAIFTMYDSWKTKFAPLWPDDPIDPRYIEACSGIDKAYDDMMEAMSKLK